jgi:spermidine synthase
MYRVLYLSLIVYGAFSQITQALLIREGLVVFYGNEISLGVFFGSWLLWIAVGSALAIPLRKRISSPLPWIRGLLLSLPLLLGIQIITTRLVRNFFDISSTQFIAFGDLFAAVTLINLPSALVIGIAFPLACKALNLELQSRHSETAIADNSQQVVQGISSLYIFDALGALVGGFAFTFLLIELAGVWISWAAVMLSIAVTSLLLGGLRQDAAPVPARLLDIAGWLWLAFAVVFLFTPLEEKFSRLTETVRFQTLQPGLELLDTVETRYGHVAIARLEEQVSVVNNGRIGISFPNTEDAEKLAAYFFTQGNWPKRILMFGGAASDLLAELLRYPVQGITVVEQDQLAFRHTLPWLPDRTRKALKDDRLEIKFQDGRHFANQLHDENYDLVLVLVADPSSAQENRYFTHEFYQRLRQLMSDSGVICTEVSSASNYFGSSISSYSGSVLATLERSFDHVAIMPGDTHTYCASSQADQVSEDARLLRWRYQMTPLDEHRFPAASFSSMLPQDRIDFVRQQLHQEQAEINSDARPVTYYYNMILWGTFSSSQFVEWLQKLKRMGTVPYLVPLLVLVVLTLLRFSMQPLNVPYFTRQSASLVLVVLGMIAMAAQLTLLYSYQAHVGFVFSRIALLNSLFMAGLALGAGFIGQQLVRSGQSTYALIAVMVSTTVMLMLLPTLYSSMGDMGLDVQQPIYLSLTVLIGLLTGTGFPLAVSLTEADTANVLHTSGLTAAADNLGGAIGGFITGALLVPILGVSMTCYTLALVAFFGTLPLLYVSTPLVKISWLRSRGYQAFPWSTLSWAVLWLVLSLFIIMLILPQEVRQPTMTFDQGRLNAVSQSNEFIFKDKPLPHYLGYDKKVEEGKIPDTVSLSSMAISHDISGYAGPINLLLSLDRNAVIRGVEYIESDETPSYISGIEQWLNTLQGISLADKPLSLDEIDGLSGATTSSRAAIETLNRTASKASQLVFEQPLFSAMPAPTIDWLQPKVIVLVLVLTLFFPVWRSGRDDWRLYYQGLVLVVLGFWFNALVTEVDLVHLTQWSMPSPYASLLHFILIAFTIVVTLLLGQVYCGYICPFGALQEFISRIGRYFYLRNEPGQHLERRMRYLKYLLLAGMLIGYWVTRDMFWVNFNPMQHFFAFNLSGWILLITVISLLGALVYYRFWCRYFCPFGAFLAFGNKIALLLKWGPQRDYTHCDLGVRDDYDIDCIHCQRCIEGKDYGLRKHSQATIVSGIEKNSIVRTGAKKGV